MILARLALCLCAAALPLLHGCAAGGVATSGVPVLLAGAATAVNPDYAPLDREVTNRALLLHPAPQVYATLLATNHWDGALTVVCEAREAQTLPRIVGSGREGSAVVHPIGDAILRELAAALAAQAAPA